MQQGQQQYQMPQMNYSMQHHQQQRQKIEKPIKGWFSYFIQNLSKYYFRTDSKPVKKQLRLNRIFTRGVQNAVRNQSILTRRMANHPG